MKNSAAIGLGVIGGITAFIGVDTLIIKRNNSIQDEASFLSALRESVEHEPHPKGTKVTEIVNNIIKGEPIYDIKVDVISLDQTWANLRTPHFNLVITKDFSASEKSENYDIFRLDF